MFLAAYFRFGRRRSLPEANMACRAVASTGSPPSPKMGYGAAAFAALRLRRLVGGDGLEPPTFCV